MSDIKQKFEEMVNAVRDATIEFSPNNTQKLKLYAFYKQATEGDVQGECPSVVHMIERAKYQAWKAVKGMTAEKAMEGYLKVFAE